MKAHVQWITKSLDFQFWIYFFSKHVIIYDTSQKQTILSFSGYLSIIHFRNAYCNLIHLLTSQIHEITSFLSIDSLLDIYPVLCRIYVLLLFYLAVHISIFYLLNSSFQLSTTELTNLLLRSTLLTSSFIL